MLLIRMMVVTVLVAVGLTAVPASAETSRSVPADRGVAERVVAKQCVTWRKVKFCTTLHRKGKRVHAAGSIKKARAGIKRTGYIMVVLERRACGVGNWEYVRSTPADSAGVWDGTPKSRRTASAKVGWGYWRARTSINVSTKKGPLGGTNVYSAISDHCK
ncbi:MAG: hypothetical protein WBP61_15145 [Nocardioides sp.]